MKPKPRLLAICLLAVSLTSALADSYQVILYPGFNAIANQLDNSDNTLNTIFGASLPNKSTAAKWDVAGQFFVSSVRNFGQWSPNFTLNPGEGAFVTPGGLSGTNTILVQFNGTPRTPVLPLSLAPGKYYLVSRQTPDPGDWDSIVGFPPFNGVVVLRLRTNAADIVLPPLGSYYKGFTFCEDGWNPETPTARVGESVFVTVLPPAPIITRDPRSQVVSLGQHASFAVEAIGLPPLSYQWRRDAIALAGETAATLDIPNVSTNHVGLYTIIVTNSYGGATSAPAVLTITYECSSTVLFTNLNYFSNNFQFSFPMQSRVSYLVQSKESLNQSNWVDAAILDGVAGTFRFVDPDAFSKERYYRVRQLCEVPWDPPGPTTNVGSRYLPPTFDNSIGTPGSSACGCQSPEGPNSGRAGCEAQADAEGNVVLTQTGELESRSVELEIPGQGFDFRFERVYRSGMNYDGPLGFRWEFTYNRRLFVETNGNVLRMDGHARSDRYVLTGGSYQSPSGFFTTLTRNSDGTFAERDPHGETYRYAPTNGNGVAVLAEIRDREGNRMLFHYDSRGQLFRVLDTLDRPVFFLYNSAGRLGQMVDFLGRTVRFYYDSYGNLEAVISPRVSGLPTCNDFPDGKATRYGYSSGFADSRLNNKLLAVTNANEAASGGTPSLVVDYDMNSASGDLGRVMSLTAGGTNATGIPAGGPLYYTYVSLGPVASNDFVSAAFQTTFTNRNGNVTENRFNQLGYVVRTVRFTRGLRSGEPPGYTNWFAYDGDGRLVARTNSELDSIEYTYDSGNPDRFQQGNLLTEVRRSGPRGGDQSQLVTSMTYEPVFNHLATVTDARGNVTRHFYDAAGNRIKTIHAITNIVEDFEYSAKGQMTAHILPDNGSGHRRRDVMIYYTTPPLAGYLYQRVVDSGGLNLTTTYEYDSAGNLIRMVGPRGNDTLYVVNSLNQVVRELSPIVNTPTGPVRYLRDTIYDANNNVVRVDVENRDESGAVVATNPLISTTNTYDILNRLVLSVQQVDPSHTITNAYAYDPEGNRTLVKYGEAVVNRQPQNVLQTLYDERDLVFRTIRAPGAIEQSTTQFDYDGNGNLVGTSQGVEDILAPRVLTYAYDGFDRRIALIDPMGNITTTHFDLNGNPTNTTIYGELIDVPGTNGNQRLSEISCAYDPMNRLTNTLAAYFDATTGADLRTNGPVRTRTLYTPNSQILAVIDDNNYGRTNTYDSANRLAIVLDAKGNTTAYQYDAKNNVVTNIETDLSDLGAPNQSFTNRNLFDNLDRLSATVDNLGNTNRYAYDSRNNRTLATDARGNMTHFNYDGLNRLIRTVHDLTDTGDSSGTFVGTMTTQQQWDDSSRLIAQIDDNTNATRYAYDPLGRSIVTRMADGTLHRMGSGSISWPAGASFPNLITFTNGYDCHDNPIVSVDANSTVVSNAVDLLNRTTNRFIFRGPGVFGSTNENRKYDGLSRMVSMQDDVSLMTRTYDSLGRLIHEANNLVAPGFPPSGNRVMTNVYDGVGNLLSLTYPGGLHVTNVYDALNRKSLVVVDGNTNIWFYYFGPGRVERRGYTNGVWCDYAYDDARRLTNITHYQTNGGTILDARAFGWDGNYNRTNRADTRPGGTGLLHTYLYDSLDRLRRTRVTQGINLVRESNYFLDGVGNRCAVSPTTNPPVCDYDVNSVNGYSTTPFDTRTYDANGNLTAITAGINTTNFHYDYRNLMVEVQPVSGSATFYTYDLLGRRAQKAVGANTTTFAYNDWQELEEEDAAGNPLVSYVYGNNLDEVLHMVRGGTNFYFHGDDLSSVFSLSGQAGDAIERYDYDDFGRPNFFSAAGTPLSQSGHGNSVLFTGRRYESDAGWYYSRTRWLDPQLGRFTTRDRIGNWGDPRNVGNGYAYVANNPLTYTDPLGLGLNDVAVKLRQLERLYGKYKKIKGYADKVNKVYDLVQQAEQAYSTKDPIAGLETIASFLRVVNSIGIVKSPGVGSFLTFYAQGIGLAVEGLKKINEINYQQYVAAKEQNAEWGDTYGVDFTAAVRGGVFHDEYERRYQLEKRAADDLQQKIDELNKQMEELKRCGMGIQIR